MPRIPLILLLSLLTACHHSPAPPHPKDTTAAHPKNTRRLYFPANVFEDSDKVVRYSNILSMLHEPILYQDPRPAEIYRFTTTPRLISVRLEKEDNKIMLYWKIPSPKLTADSLRLTEAQWQKYLQLLKNTDFWNMPTSSNREGDDGGQYILEGKTPDNYHVVDRWSPGGGPYEECCIYLLHLAKLLNQ